MQQSDINNRFAFHAASTEEKRNAHTSARVQCRQLADYINEKVPAGREQALAITSLELVMFWCNAGIARQDAINVENIMVTT